VRFRLVVPLDKGLHQTHEMTPQGAAVCACQGVYQRLEPLHGVILLPTLQGVTNRHSRLVMRHRDEILPGGHGYSPVRMRNAKRDAQPGLQYTMGNGVETIKYHMQRGGWVSLSVMAVEASVQERG
jgi:hypothetical protein